jgi:excisionase family DNA binding protein
MRAGETRSMVTKAEMETQGLLTQDQVANRLGVSRRFVWEITNCGKIAHIRLGRLVRYRPEDVEDFITSSRRVCRAR